MVLSLEYFSTAACATRPRSPPTKEEGTRSKQGRRDPGHGPPLPAPSRRDAAGFRRSCTSAAARGLRSEAARAGARRSRRKHRVGPAVSSRHTWTGRARHDYHFPSKFVTDARYSLFRIRLLFSTASTRTFHHHPPLSQLPPPESIDHRCPSSR